MQLQLDWQEGDKRLQIGQPGLHRISLLQIVMLLVAVIFDLIKNAHS